MDMTTSSIKNTISNFIEALALSGKQIDINKIKINNLGCPHDPTPLPSGNMAIYIFIHGDIVYKIGKVGPKSNARFQTQHYFPESSKSNLAKSLLDDETSPCCNLPPTEIGSWIKQNLTRIDLMLDSNIDVSVLNFFEAFLHCRYVPKYEGFKRKSGAII